LNIHPTAIIHPGAELAEDVVVGPYAVIEDKVKVGRGTKIGAHAVIKSFAEIGEYNEIFQFASIGDVPQDVKFKGEDSKLVVGDRNKIREYVTLNRGTVGGGGVTRIGSDCFILAYAHVAHDCIVEDHVVIVNAVQMGGHVHIEEHAVIGGLSALHQYIRIGRHSMTGGGSILSQDAAPYTTVVGNRARASGLNLVGITRRGFTPETIAALKKAYRVIFRTKATVKEARELLASEAAAFPEVNHMLEFVETTVRGVCR